MLTPSISAMDAQGHDVENPLIEKELIAQDIEEAIGGKRELVRHFCCLTTSVLLCGTLSGGLFSAAAFGVSSSINSSNHLIDKINHLFGHDTHHKSVTGIASAIVGAVFCVIVVASGLICARDRLVVNKKLWENGTTKPKTVLNALYRGNVPTLHYGELQEFKELTAEKLKNPYHHIMAYYKDEPSHPPPLILSP